MKVLFVTYCFGTEAGPQLEGGQVLIGVYKRGLRVAHEMCDRGHEVYFLCDGEDNFHDDSTTAAKERMTFLDWDLQEDTPEEFEDSHQRFLAGLRDISPDLVVIGEAPLAGALLECTLCAAELGIPAVCLDNAYGADQAKLFCDAHGAIYDGIILTGPSSFQTPDPPPYLFQVPPYMVADREATQALLAELGLGDGDHQVTVLAYDHNVEKLGAALLSQLSDLRLDAVFITHKLEDCKARLAALPKALRQRIRVIPPQSDPLLFGLLQNAHLAVGKCAFMQVTESLSLMTPIIGYYFEGDFHLRCIPEVCHAFAHSSTEADPETVEIARRYLDLRPENMLSVHDGSLRAAARAAEFLEQVPSLPRRDTTSEARLHHGIEPDFLRRALAASSGTPIEIREVRSTRIRNPPGQQIYALVCHYRVDGEDRTERLWWHRFSTPEKAREQAEGIAEPESGRHLYRVDLQNHHLLEADVGQKRLPPVDDV